MHSRHADQVGKASSEGCSARARHSWKNASIAFLVVLIVVMILLITCDPLWTAAKEAYATACAGDISHIATHILLHPFIYYMYNLGSRPCPGCLPTLLLADWDFTCCSVCPHRHPSPAGESVTGVLVTDPVAYTTLFVEQCQGAGIDCRTIDLYSPTITLYFPRHPFTPSARLPFSLSPSLDSLLPSLCFPVAPFSHPPQT